MSMPLIRKSSLSLSRYTTSRLKISILIMSVKLAYWFIMFVWVLAIRRLQKQPKGGVILTIIGIMVKESTKSKLFMA